MSDQSNPKDFPYGNTSNNSDQSDSRRQSTEQQDPYANHTNSNPYGNGDYSNQANQGAAYHNNEQQQQHYNQYQQQAQQPNQQNYQPYPPNYNPNQPNQGQYYNQQQNGNYVNPPYYQNNPYQQQPPIYQTRRTNTKSIVALILGIASISIPYIGFFIGIAGIILSSLSLKEIPRKQEEGKGLAIAGLVTSIIGTLLYGIILLFVIGLFIFAFDTSSNNFYY